MQRAGLTNWADQVLKKRLENVRGVGSVTLVGGTKREINIYLNPAAMEALGIGADQVVAAVRNENQELPVGAIRSLAQERVCRSTRACSGPKTSAGSSWRARAARRCAWTRSAEVADGPQEVDSLALYNGQRTLLLTVQKAQDENTIEVVDGVTRTSPRCKPQLPPGVRLELITRRLAADPRVGGRTCADADRRRPADRR